MIQSATSSTPVFTRNTIAESRAVDTSEPQITPSPAPAVAAAVAGLAEETLRKLQDTLRELQECRKLLDAALAPEAT